MTTMMNQDFQLFKWVFFYESVDDYIKSKKIHEESDKKTFIPLFSQLSTYVGIKDDFEFNDNIYKENKRELMLADIDIDSTDFKHLMRKMIRDVLKHCRRINVPNMDSIKNRVELWFLNN